MNTISDVVKKNTAFWAKLKPCKKKVLVEGRLSPAQLINMSLLGIMQNNEDSMEPIVVTNNAKQDLRELYGSFGIQNFISIGSNREMLRSPFLLIKSLFQTSAKLIVLILNGYNFKNFIEGYRLNGVLVGDLIYDTFIRYEHRYLNSSSHTMYLFKLTLRATFKFNRVWQIFSKNEVSRVVVSTWDYADTAAFMARIASHKKIPILVSSKNFFKVFTNEQDPYCYNIKVNYENSYLLQAKKDLDEAASKYVEERMAGMRDELCSQWAYQGKKVWSNNELLTSLKIEPNDQRPKVFIMPHCFSDANHAAGNLLFNDYYTWFVETLKKAKECPDTIWFVRTHPCAYMYHEEGQVEAIYEKFKDDHIHLIPDDFSTASVFSIADVVLTCRGTIGLEAASMGIKTIVSGNSPYSGFDIVHEPKTKEEYLSLLGEVAKLPKMSERQIQEARRVFYLYLYDHRYDCEYFSNFETLRTHQAGGNQKNIHLVEVFKAFFDYLDKKGNPILIEDYFLTAKKIIEKTKAANPIN